MRHWFEHAKANRKRERVKDMMSVWRVSERRTYRVMQAHRSTQQYKTIRSDQADLKKRIKGKEGKQLIEDQLPDERRNLCSLRLSPYPCHAEARRLAGERQTHIPALS
jgi:hypothetical protein